LFGKEFFWHFFCETALKNLSKTGSVKNCFLTDKNNIYIWQIKVSLLTWIDG
jgi:hypothetical protein